VNVVALVLAAGRGTRFGGEPGSKLLAEVDGMAVVAHAIGAAVASGLPTIVVHGAVDLTRQATALGAAAVRNDRFADGLASSLCAGIAAAGDADAVVVGLGDQPDVVAATWRALADTGAPIAVATYEGRRGNPVRLSREVWPLLPTTGDEGARSLLRDRPDLVTEVPSSGSPADIDLPADLARRRH
jgi:molybdenum cofactor cytidylyltransferase